MFFFLTFSLSVFCELYKHVSSEPHMILKHLLSVQILKFFEIQIRWKSGNVCYHSVQNVLFSSLLSKNLKFKIYRTINLPVVLYRCETSPIAAGNSSCLTCTVAVYAVLSSWWWTERHVERFTRTNNLR